MRDLNCLTCVIMYLNIYFHQQQPRDVLTLPEDYVLGIFIYTYHIYINNGYSPANSICKLMQLSEDSKLMGRDETETQHW